MLQTSDCMDNVFITKFVLCATQWIGTKNGTTSGLIQVVTPLGTLLPLVPNDTNF